MTARRYHCPMRWADMDAQAHVNNAAFLDYLQEARVNYLLCGPPVMRELLDTGVLVVSHQLEYLAPVVFSPTPLVVDLWVDAVGASRFVIGYEVRDGETVAVRARTAAAPFDLAENRLRRLSPAEREVLLGDLAPAAALPELQRPAAAGRDHRFPLAVRWSDLDSYGHVNNVKYYDYVQEARIALVVEALGWGTDDVWLVVRQDLDYKRPLDFRPEPYEVGTSVLAVGRRSFTLAAEIRDPLTAVVYATARTVVVAPAPLDEPRRAALEAWQRG